MVCKAPTPEHVPPQSHRDYWVVLHDPFKYHPYGGVGMDMMMGIYMPQSSSKLSEGLKLGPYLLLYKGPAPFGKIKPPLNNDAKTELLFVKLK